MPPPEPTVIVLNSGIGFGLGYVLRHWLSLSRDAGKRRRKFRDDLRCLLNEVNAHQIEKLAGWHYDSLSKVADLCSRVKEDIRWRKRRRFVRARNHYMAMSGREIENPNPEHAVKYQFTSERPEGRLFDFEKGKRGIRDALQELIDAAK